MKKSTPKPRSLPLTLAPLRPSEALSLFMQVDPRKVEEGMQKARFRGVRKSALSKA
jgi:hypothetical protein